MKKKMMSLALALVMCMTLCVPAFANTISESPSYTVTLYPLGNGEYATSPMTRSPMARNSDDSISATVSEYEGMLAVSETSFLTPTGNNTYLLVDKIEIDTDNFDTSLATLEDYDIPEDYIEGIETTIAEQKRLGNEELKVSVFAPPTETSQNETRTASANPPIYYTYKRYRFKDIITQYSHMSSGMVEKTGKDTMNVARSITNLVISCVGVASKSVSLFGAGLSALAVYEAAYGPVTYGATGDRLYTNIIYNKTVKETDSWSEGNQVWRYGLISYHADITRQETYQYYSAIGEGRLFSNDLNTTMSSEHFYSAAQEVIDWNFEHCGDNLINLKVYATTVVL